MTELSASDRQPYQARAMATGALGLCCAAAAYLLFAGSAGLTECLAGLGVSVAAAAYALRLQRAAQRRLALRPAAFLWVGVRATAGLLPDAARVGGVLLRAILARPDGAAGRLTAQPFRRGGDDPNDAGRRGAVILGLSFAPNGYVVAEEPGALLLHQLAPAAPRADTEWPA